MSDTDVATLSPLAQEWMATGFEKGRERMIETLLRILTKSFGEVTPTVRDKLHAIHDVDLLGQLTETAWDCQSLTEFEAAMNK